MSQTHWKKLHNPNYLGAYVFEPNQPDLILTIANVAPDIVKGEDGKEGECLIARFKEAGIKPMILNKTNCKIIAKIHGTPYIEDWSGKKIAVYVAKVRAFGDTVEALRIRPEIPTKNLPQLTPSHEKWQGAIDAIRDGRNTIEGVQEYFSLSADNKKLLLEAAQNAKA